MPHKIDLGMAPAGYALTGARQGEDHVLVQFMEFTSTEDGQHFVQRLEGIANDILVRVPTSIGPSQVDSMLALIRRDGKATVYVNEVQLCARVRASGPIKAGAPVTKNDIVDVDRLELDVEIPDDVGVLLLFSVGWRKGLFYDFGPVGAPDPEPRKYDLRAMLGQCYCHVLFQERFSISDVEWAALFATKWFPFAGLRNETTERLISRVRSGWDPDEQIEQMVSEIKNRVPQMVDGWRKHPSFAPHIEILERAVERFQMDDYVSSTGLLFPRIEGILRTHHAAFGAANSPKPDHLTESAVASKIHNMKCLLLPHKFAQYLREVYFANFNPVA